MIQKKYNPDEIGRRILNGDGGSWIKEPYDDEASFIKTWAYRKRKTVH